MKQIFLTILVLHSLVFAAQGCWIQGCGTGRRSYCVKSVSKIWGTCDDPFVRVAVKVDGQEGKLEHECRRPYTSAELETLRKCNCESYADRCATCSNCGTCQAAEGTCKAYELEVHCEKAKADKNKPGEERICPILDRVTAIEAKKYGGWATGLIDTVKKYQLLQAVG